MYLSKRINFFLVCGEVKIPSNRGVKSPSALALSIIKSITIMNKSILFEWGLQKRRERQSKLVLIAIF